MKHYVAVTHDVFGNFEEVYEMNTYPLETLDNLEEQCQKLSDKDVAPLVVVYECDEVINTKDGELIHVVVGKYKEFVYEDQLLPF